MRTDPFGKNRRAGLGFFPTISRCGRHRPGLSLAEGQFFRVSVRAKYRCGYIGRRQRENGRFSEVVWIRKVSANATSAPSSLRPLAAEDPQKCRSQMTEATARIKINKLLEAAGWRFFADLKGPRTSSSNPALHSQNRRSTTLVRTSRKRPKASLTSYCSTKRASRLSSSRQRPKAKAHFLASNSLRTKTAAGLSSLSLGVP